MTTAQQHIDSASKHIDASYESFQRCDTDGFMSQWAHDVMAQVHLDKAKDIENGNMAMFGGLYDGDRRVMAKIIDTKFGASWLLSDEEAAKYGRKFVPVGTNSRVQKQLGLSERDEMAPAWVTTGGASITSVRSIIFRTGDKWGSDAVLCQE